MIASPLFGIHGKKHLVMLRLETSCKRGTLAEMQNAPELMHELGQCPILRRRERAGGHA